MKIVSIVGALPNFMKVAHITSLRQAQYKHAGVKKKISENSCNSWQKTQSRQEQKANTEDYEQQRREGAGVGGWRMEMERTFADVV